MARAKAAPAGSPTDPAVAVWLRELDHPLKREFEAVRRAILHQGAKVKDGSTKPKIADPSGLLKWISSNRCMVTLGRGKEVAARLPALQSIVREWIGQL